MERREEGRLCPVCGRFAFAQRASFVICPFCGWEDDPLQTEDPTLAVGANELCLNDYRARYETLLAVDPAYCWKTDGVTPQEKS